MRGWFVVRAKYRSETTARDELARLGFEVFLPEHKVRRFSRRNNRKAEDVLRPLYPPYLFVAFDPDADPWRRITGTRGVDHLLCHLEQPIRIPTDEIARVRGEAADASKPKPRFKVGDRLRVLEGPLAAFEGRCELSDLDQVEILLGLLGRDVRVRVLADMVEAAA